jgi:hypothetical protein
MRELFLSIGKLEAGPVRQDHDDGAGGDEQAAGECRRGEFFAQQQPGEDMTSGTLSLSSGATREAGPSCRARK